MSWQTATQRWTSLSDQIEPQRTHLALPMVPHLVRTSGAVGDQISALEDIGCPVDLDRQGASCTTLPVPDSSRALSVRRTSFGRRSSNALATLARRSCPTARC